MLLKSKVVKALSTLGIAATLFSAPASAAYVPAYEPDSFSYPNILHAGDWANTALTQYDHDYYKLTNNTSVTRRYHVLLQSPSGYDYGASVSGNYITPTLSVFGRYEWDVIVNPGYDLRLNVYSLNGAYTTSTYILTVDDTTY